MVQRSGGRGPRRERAEEEARRLPGVPFEEYPPEDMDAAVNGPEWNFHVIPTVEISTTEIAARKRVLAQASRRVKRAEADQILINDLHHQLSRAEHMAECKITELANFHQGAEDMRRMQAVHRARRVIQVDNLVLKIRALEAAANQHEEEMAREREGNAIAQLLIARYKAKEDEEAEQEHRSQHRRSRDDDQHENELDTLRTHNEQLRALLEEENKKSERFARDRSKSMKNLAEAESGARRQGGELSNREGTIALLTDKLEKVTRDSIKKSTTINELQRDFDKKAAKVEELRTQRTGLRNRLDEQESLLQKETPSSTTCEHYSASAPRKLQHWKPPRTRVGMTERGRKLSWRRHGSRQEPTERRRHPWPDR